MEISMENIHTDVRVERVKYQRQRVIILQQ